MPKNVFQFFKKKKYQGPPIFIILYSSMQSRFGGVTEPFTRSAYEEDPQEKLRKQEINLVIGFK